MIMASSTASESESEAVASRVIAYLHTIKRQLDLSEGGDYDDAA